MKNNNHNISKINYSFQLSKFCIYSYSKVYQKQYACTTLARTCWNRADSWDLGLSPGSCLAYNRPLFPEQPRSQSLLYMCKGLSKVSYL